MNPQQIGQLYDLFPESQRDMPREQFIRKALDACNPTKNRKILGAMIERKCQIKTGQMEQAQIDAAIRQRK